MGDGLAACPIHTTLCPCAQDKGKGKWGRGGGGVASEQETLPSRMKGVCYDALSYLKSLGSSGRWWRRSIADTLLSLPSRSAHKVFPPGRSTTALNVLFSFRWEPSGQKHHSCFSVCHEACENSGCTATLTKVEETARRQA